MKNYTKEQLLQVINTSQSMMEAATKMDCNFKTFFKYAKLHGVFKPNQAGKGMNKKRPAIPLEDILNGLQPQYHAFKLKERLIKESYFTHKCSSCGIEEWMGQKAPIELDHINGISHDHRLENLRLLCPNCHAQTPTYRAKNKRNTKSH